MNYFVGFFLDDKSRKKIVGKVTDVSKIFSDMGIQVRWIKPSNYHIKIQNLFSNLGFIRKLYLNHKMKGFFKSSIHTSVGKVKIGGERNLKGLIYLEIDTGGDSLRDLRYKMAKNLKIKDNVQFIPHIALGRINKDLTNQEYSNILKDLENISDKLSRDKIDFNINRVSLIKVEGENYEILKNFDILS
jgi:2'-5' RNA ligase